MKRETPDQPESQEPARAEPTTTEENQDAPPTVIRRRVNGSEGGSDVGQSPQRAAVPVSSNANSSPTFGQRSLSDRSPEQGHASATDRRGTHISDLSGLKASDKAASPRTAAPALSELPAHLEVHAIDLRAQQVEVTYDSPIALPKGTRMHVYHAYLLTGDAIVGETTVATRRRPTMVVAAGPRPPTTVVVASPRRPITVVAAADRRLPGAVVVAEAANPRLLPGARAAGLD